MTPRLLLLSWLALIAVLASPPLRALLESSMSAHMLIQIPLLTFIGFALGQLWQTHGGRTLHWLQAANRGGTTGIVLASFGLMLWMLPRALDSATLDPWLDTAKFISLIAAGGAIALSWPRLPVIARGVVHVEVIATFLRFGWGYLAADERLCLTYLAGDQQRTGTLLLGLAALYAVAVVWRPLFGGRLAE